MLVPQVYIQMRNPMSAGRRKEAGGGTSRCTEQNVNQEWQQAPRAGRQASREPRMKRGRRGRQNAESRSFQVDLMTKQVVPSIRMAVFHLNLWRGRSRVCQAFPEWNAVQAGSGRHRQAGGRQAGGGSGRQVVRECGRKCR